MARSMTWLWTAPPLLLAAVCAHAADSFYAFRVSNPLIASASAGLRFGSEIDRFRPAVEVEAGLGGGRFLMGLDSLGEGPALGLKPAFLRTWLDPAGTDAGESYVGAVLQVGYDRFFAEAGGYHQVAGGGDDDEWLATLGIGFLF